MNHVLRFQSESLVSPQNVIPEYIAEFVKTLVKGYPYSSTPIVYT